jgi:hypothetical protein
VEKSTLNSRRAFLFPQSRALAKRNRRATCAALFVGFGDAEFGGMAHIVTVSPAEGPKNPLEEDFRRPV